MNTVARPATCESGSLVRATAASMAASYWIGPSTSSDGARSRTIAVASMTLSTSEPGPGAAGRVRQHRHPRLDPERRRRPRRGQRDVRELRGRSGPG
jgi:hypothetical protein